MKLYRTLVLVFVSMITMCACISSHKDEIVDTVDGYLSILKSGENLDSRDDYCTDTYAGDLSTIDEQLNTLVNGEEVGNSFDEEAKEFIRVCFMNFIDDYTIESIDESDKEAIVNITIHGIDFNEFSMDAYEDEIAQAKEEYVNAHMDEYEEIYNTEGEQAAYDRYYDDASKAVFDKMKEIVYSLDKKTYTVNAIVIEEDGIWKIDNLIVE